MKYKINPEVRAIQYLVSKGWEYDDESLAAKELKFAFNSYGSKSKDLSETLHYLYRKAWFFYSLGDIKKIDNARKIYNKYNR